MAIKFTAVQRDKDGYIIQRDSEGNIISRKSDPKTYEIQERNKKSKRL